MKRIHLTHAQYALLIGLADEYVENMEDDARSMDPTDVDDATCILAAKSARNFLDTLPPA